MKVDSKVALLVPYFGIWPEYFNLFLDSFKNVKNIDLIFITDLPEIVDSNKHIKFHKLSFEDLKVLIGQKLHINTSNLRPYKICDLRPAFGELFGNILDEYTHWGYCDIDLIFGDVDKYVSIDILDNYDVITHRINHLQGPFTIYRNNTYCNNLFRQSPNFKQIFESPEYLSFDEFGRTGFHLKNEVNFSSIEKDNISAIVFNEKMLGNLKLYHSAISKEVICDSKERLIYRNGAVVNIDSNEEYSFYHWVWEKRAIWFKYPNWEMLPNEYYISETGFYTTEEFKTYWLRHSTRKFVGAVKWFNLKCTNYLKRRIGAKVVIDTYPRIGFTKKL